MSDDTSIIKLVKDNYLDVKTHEKLVRTGVTNNKLYILNKDTPNPVILKIYYNDHRHRLEREYAGYEFFNKLGSNLTPKPLFRDYAKYFAGYSFLPGKVKEIDDITKEDMSSIADFVVFLHENSQKAHNLGLSFESAIASCFSIQETINKINMKVNKFVGDESVDIYDCIKEFKSRHEIRKIFDHFINEAKKDIEVEEIEKLLSLEKQSLSPVDLNFSNILFDGSSARFLDFEDFGWDDPVNIFGFFIYHDRVSDISFDMKAHFISEYIRIRKPDENFKSRLRAILYLGGILWLSTYLLALTEEKLKVRRFTDPDFKEVPYLEGRIARFEEKYEEYSSSDSLADMV